MEVAPARQQGLQRGCGGPRRSREAGGRPRRRSLPRPPAAAAAAAADGKHACQARIRCAPPPIHPPGFASLRLDLDAQRNPAIFEQLLQQTPAALIALGKPILAEQRRQVAAAVAASFEVALGGAAGGKLGWGRCLAVRVGQELAGLRSQLGNALAEESQRRGLRAVAAVAYVEARVWRRAASLCVWRAGAGLQGLLGCSSLHGVLRLSSAGCAQTLPPSSALPAPSCPCSPP